ncbi:MAG: type II 3-dehydroquinate dehydratase [Candidatus Eremiobacteraeota bacterium]|nr:type II 3-dehydroquinate dehydratase [Candidatus Eremiobacteraeota bacterium]
MSDLLVIHGVNLSLLGEREREIYGRSTLKEIDRKIREISEKLGMSVEIFQTNHEGAIIDRMIECSNKAKVIILNPGAFTHYSYAIRDCVSGVGVPTIEVHLSNIYSREPFRQSSVVAPVCLGQISGFGADSYILAVKMAKKIIDGR